MRRHRGVNRSNACSAPGPAVTDGRAALVSQVLAPPSLASGFGEDHILMRTRCPHLRSHDHLVCVATAMASEIKNILFRHDGLTLVEYDDGRFGIQRDGVPLPGCRWDP